MTHDHGHGWIDIVRACKQCGKQFTAHRVDKIYCSPVCVRASQYERHETEKRARAAAYYAEHRVSIKLKRILGVKS